MRYNGVNDLAPKLNESIPMSQRPRTGQTGLLGKPEPPPSSSQTNQVLLARAPVPAPTHLLLQIGRAPGTVTTIGRRVNDKLVLGRGDITINYQPDVDFAPFDAVKNGISRHHALILRLNNALYIQDTKSRNGTHLNDIKLPPEQPFPLYDGDTVMVGGLQIVVWYVTSR